MEQLATLEWLCEVKISLRFDACAPNAEAVRVMHRPGHPLLSQARLDLIPLCQRLPITRLLFRRLNLDLGTTIRRLLVTRAHTRTSFPSFAAN
jgi:hypothetical protein